MRLLALACTVALTTAAAQAQVGLVDFDGTELGLLSYTNNVVTYSGPNLGTDAGEQEAFSTDFSFGDAFFPMTRAAVGPFSNTAGVNLSMPFSISDDSVSPATGNTLFETDTQGFAGIAQDDNGFFGVTDTVNGNNPNEFSIATWEFDVSGLSSITVDMDMAAMGDFEDPEDVYALDYSLDGGSTFDTLFAFSVDEDGDQTYFMDNPDNNPVVITDPLLVDGVALNDDFQNFSTALTGSGSTLIVRLTVAADGSGEGFGLDNIRVTPAPGAVALLGLAGLVARRRRRG